MRTVRGKAYAWKASANRRGIKWELTREFLETIPLICYYTGDTLTLEQGFGHTVSLDRIDSTLHYVEGNVVFCRTDINWMKNILAQTDFIEMCKKVANNF